MIRGRKPGLPWSLSGCTSLSTRRPVKSNSTTRLAPGRSLPRREIRKLAERTRARGLTLIPLKMYFVRGRAKILIGLARGKRRRDKREDLAKQQAQRDMARAMLRRGGGGGRKDVG